MANVPDVTGGRVTPMVYAAYETPVQLGQLYAYADTQTASIYTKR